MKHKIYLILALAIAFVGCKTEEPEVHEVTPTADFSYVINNLTVYFTNKSSDAERYYWDFGDGTDSSEKDPTKTYSEAGKFTVTLKAKNETRSDKCSKTIEVSVGAPKANFTYKVAQPLKVILTNTSTNATSYQWDFGDGGKSSERNPVHSYNGIGVYRIKLTVTGNGKTDTYEANVKIEAPTLCYITGFIIKSIPNNNYYYQAQLTDDYIMSKTTYFWTDWYLLSSANIPYSYRLQNNKKLDINETYVFRLYKNSAKQSGQATGKGFWTAYITPAILQKYPETLLISSSSASVQLNFLWQ